ncbi:MAG TPA: prolipoprotein diacylglyceryl transferase [bacterium]
MFPVLVRMGPVTIHTYGVMLILAFVVSTWLAARTARAWPRESVEVPAEALLDLVSIALLGGIAGGRLFFAALYWEVFRDAPWRIFAIWEGGLVWYGGLLGGMLAAGGWLMRRGRSWIAAFDQLAPFVALGHAIGRLGCFLNGCCYGRPTEAWFGVTFPGHPAPVLPTQLIEAAGLLGCYVLLRRLQRDGQPVRRGRVGSAYLIAYGLLRFGMEFLRGDQGIWLAGLTLQQGISAALIAAGLVLRTASPSGRARSG